MHRVTLIKGKMGSALARTRLMMAGKGHGQRNEEINNDIHEEPPPPPDKAIQQLNKSPSGA